MQVAYLVLAAAFGYFAVALHKRYEFVRSTAVEIDALLHRAENLLKSDEALRLKPSFLNPLIEVLEDAERLALGLPDRLLKPAQEQIHMANYVVTKAFGDNKPEHLPIHAAIVGAREVVAPLLRPYVFPPRTAKPKSSAEGGVERVAKHATVGRVPSGRYASPRDGAGNDVDQCGATAPRAEEREDADSPVRRHRR